METQLTPSDSLYVDSTSSPDNVTLNHSGFEDLGPDRQLEQLNMELFSHLLPALGYLFLLTVVGIAGNLVVLCVYFTAFRSSSRGSVSCLPAVLASCDLTVCCVVLPLDMYRLVNFYTASNPLFCKMHMSGANTLVLASALTVAAIYVERCLKMCRPFVLIDRGRVKVVCGLTALILLGLWFSWAFAAYDISRPLTPTPALRGYSCESREGEDSLSFFRSYMWTYASCFLLVLVLMIVCHVFVWRYLLAARHGALLPDRSEGLGTTPRENMPFRSLSEQQEQSALCDLQPSTTSPSDKRDGESDQLLISHFPYADNEKVHATDTKFAWTQKGSPQLSEWSEEVVDLPHLSVPSRGLQQTVIPCSSLPFDKTRPTFPSRMLPFDHIQSTLPDKMQSHVPIYDWAKTEKGRSEMSDILSQTQDSELDNELTPLDLSQTQDSALDNELIPLDLSQTQDSEMAYKIPQSLLSDLFCHPAESAVDYNLSLPSSALMPGDDSAVDFLFSRSDSIQFSDHIDVSGANELEILPVASSAKGHEISPNAACASMTITFIVNTKAWPHTTSACTSTEILPNISSCESTEIQNITENINDAIYPVNIKDKSSISMLSLIEPGKETGLSECIFKQCSEFLEPKLTFLLNEQENEYEPKVNAFMDCHYSDSENDIHVGHTNFEVKQSIRENEMNQKKACDVVPKLERCESTVDSLQQEAPTIDLNAQPLTPATTLDSIPSMSDSFFIPQNVFLETDNQPQTSLSVSQIFPSGSGSVMQSALTPSQVCTSASSTQSLLTLPELPQVSTSTSSKQLSGDQPKLLLQQLSELLRHTTVGMMSEQLKEFSGIFQRAGSHDVTQRNLQQLSHQGMRQLGPDGHSKLVVLIKQFAQVSKECVSAGKVHQIVNQLRQLLQCPFTKDNSQRVQRLLRLLVQLTQSLSKTDKLREIISDMDCLNKVNLKTDCISKLQVLVQNLCQNILSTQEIKRAQTIIQQLGQEMMEAEMQQDLIDQLSDLLYTMNELESLEKAFFFLDQLRQIAKFIPNAEHSKQAKGIIRRLQDIAEKKMSSRTSLSQELEGSTTCDASCSKLGQSSSTVSDQNFLCVSSNLICKTSEESLSVDDSPNSSLPACLQSSDGLSNQKDQSNNTSYLVQGNNISYLVQKHEEGSKQILWSMKRRHSLDKCSSFSKQAIFSLGPLLVPEQDGPGVDSLNDLLHCLKSSDPMKSDNNAFVQESNTIQNQQHYQDIQCKGLNSNCYWTDSNVFISQAKISGSIGGNEHHKTDEVLLTSSEHCKLCFDDNCKWSVETFSMCHLCKLKRAANENGTEANQPTNGIVSDTHNDHQPRQIDGRRNNEDSKPQLYWHNQTNNSADDENLKVKLVPSDKAIEQSENFLTQKTLQTIKHLVEGINNASNPEFSKSALEIIDNLSSLAKDSPDSKETMQAFESLNRLLNNAHHNARQIRRILEQLYQLNREAAEIEYSHWLLEQLMQITRSSPDAETARKVYQLAHKFIQVGTDSANSEQTRESIIHLNELTSRAIDPENSLKAQQVISELMQIGQFTSNSEHFQQLLHELERKTAKIADPGYVQAAKDLVVKLLQESKASANPERRQQILQQLRSLIEQAPEPESTEKAKTIIAQLDAAGRDVFASRRQHNVVYQNVTGSQHLWHQFLESKNIAASVEKSAQILDKKEETLLSKRHHENVQTAQQMYGQYPEDARQMEYSLNAEDTGDEKEGILYKENDDEKEEDILDKENDYDKKDDILDKENSDDKRNDILDEENGDDKKDYILDKENDDEKEEDILAGETGERKEDLQEKPIKSIQSLSSNEKSHHRTEDLADSTEDIAHSTEDIAHSTEDLAHRQNTDTFEESVKKSNDIFNETSLNDDGEKSISSNDSAESAIHLSPRKLSTEQEEAEAQSEMTDTNEIQAIAVKTTADKATQCDDKGFRRQHIDNPYVLAIQKPGISADGLSLLQDGRSILKGVHIERVKMQLRNDMPVRRGSPVDPSPFRTDKMIQTDAIKGLRTKMFDTLDQVFHHNLQTIHDKRFQQLNEQEKSETLQRLHLRPALRELQALTGSTVITEEPPEDKGVINYDLFPESVDPVTRRGAAKSQRKKDKKKKSELHSRALTEERFVHSLDTDQMQMKEDRKQAEALNDTVIAEDSPEEKDVINYDLVPESVEPVTPRGTAKSQRRNSKKKKSKLHSHALSEEKLEHSLDTDHMQMKEESKQAEAFNATVIAEDSPENKDVINYDLVPESVETKSQRKKSKKKKSKLHSHELSEKKRVHSLDTDQMQMKEDSKQTGALNDKPDNPSFEEQSQRLSTTSGAPVSEAWLEAGQPIKWLEAGQPVKLLEAGKLMPTQPKTFKRQKNSSTQLRRKLSKVTLTKMTLFLFIISFIFFVCYFTSFFVILLESGQSSMQYRGRSHIAWVEFCRRLSFTQNALNPFIYTLYNTQFRRKIQDLTHRSE